MVTCSDFFFFVFLDETDLRKVPDIRLEVGPLIFGRLLTHTWFVDSTSFKSEIDLAIWNFTRFAMEKRFDERLFRLVSRVRFVTNEAGWKFRLISTFLAVYQLLSTNRDSIIKYYSVDGSAMRERDIAGIVSVHRSLCSR